jgi:hypothetical protein
MRKRVRLCESRAKRNKRECVLRGKGGGGGFVFAIDFFSSLASATGDLHRFEYRRLHSIGPLFIEMHAPVITRPPTDAPL